MKNFKKTDHRQYPKKSFSSVKPFGYINLTKNVIRNEALTHESIKANYLTGNIKLEIQVISDYLFSGSGNYDFRKNDKLVYYTFFRTNNKLAIPGTSIKGSVRSVAEAISNSCVSQMAGRKKVGRNKYKDDEKKYFSRNDSRLACNNYIKLCPTCSIFGTTDYSGKISFLDASPLKNVKTEIVKIGELFSPKIVKKQRKFYQNKRFNPIGNLIPEKQHRFVEAVKKNNKFVTLMKFQNLSEKELSLILYSMGIKQDYNIKIGGAKPRCFGIVKIQPLEIELLDTKALFSNNIFIKKDLDFIDEILENTDLLNKETFESFKKSMKFINDQCPKGNY